MKGLSASVRDFCLNMVSQTIKNREATGEVRKDLMQYLIQLRNNSLNLENEDCNTDLIGNALRHKRKIESMFNV